jgi:hypothetical protein
MRLLLLLMPITMAATSCEKDVVVDVGPVSAADAKAFTDKMLESLGKGCTTDSIADFVDEKALAGHVMEHSKSKGPARTTVADTLIERHTGATVVCSWFTLDQGSQYKLLHLKDGAPIVRKTAKLGTTTAVTYFKLVLGTTKADKQVRLDDAYSFTQGATMSEALAETVDAGIKSGIEGSSEIEPAMTKVKQLRADKKPLEAMAVLDGLPQEVKDVRAIRVVRVFVAREISEQRYSQEMAEVMKHYPNDPSLALIAVDEATLRKDYKGALKEVDILDQAVGGDAFQDAVRSTIYYLMNDFQNAKGRAAAAVKAEPDLVRAQFSLADADAALGDYKGVLAQLQLLAKMGQPVSAAALATVPHYEGFAVSPEGKQWAAEHP